MAGPATIQMHPQTYVSPASVDEQPADINMSVLKRWLYDRDALEREIAALTAELEASPVGLRGNLLDAEGFPRSDIDIPAIRVKRNRLAMMHTDHKIISKKLEAGMVELHARTKNAPLQPSGSASGSLEGPSSSSGPAGSAQTMQPTPSLQSFARIDQVFPNSPGAEAGFAVGDTVFRFGDVERSGGLAAVARLVGERAGQPIEVLVSRSGMEQRVVVTPHTWEGRGLLGIHLVPL
eukprot:tig00000865_g5075.t1